MPRKLTDDKSGTLRLASPPPDDSVCAQAKAGSSRLSSAASVYRLFKNFMQFITVTNPPGWLSYWSARAAAIECAPDLLGKCHRKAITRIQDCRVIGVTGIGCLIGRCSYRIKAGAMAGGRPRDPGSGAAAADANSAPLERIPLIRQTAAQETRKAGWVRWGTFGELAATSLFTCNRANGGVGNLASVLSSVAVLYCSNSRRSHL